MGVAFDILYEKINSNDAPGVTTSEKSFFLSKAQRQLALQIIRKITNPVKEGLEESELRKQGLGNLIKDSEDSSSTGTILLPASSANLQNGRFWQLPEDFWFTILEQAWIDKQDCKVTTPTDLEVEMVKVVTHNEVQLNSRNPYRKPSFKGDRAFIWRLEYERDISGYDMLNSTTQNITPPRHELITDGSFNVNRYKIRYIKLPRNIVIDTVTPVNQKNSELAIMLHDAIVELAVKIASIALREPISPEQSKSVDIT